MDSNLRHQNRADPLLFHCTEMETELEGLLHLQTADHEDSFSTSFNMDVDALEPDIENWLQNSSISQLSTAVDTEHNVSISEGHLLPVNPDSVLPQQPAAQTPQKEENALEVKLKDADTVSNAGSSSQASCSRMENVNYVPQVRVTPSQQQVQHIQIVAIPITDSSGHQHVLPASVNQSPLKSNTIILDGNTGTFSVAGTTYITTSPQKLQTICSGERTLRPGDSSPSQSSPVYVGHLQSRVGTARRPVTLTLESPLKHTQIVPQSQTKCEPKHTVRSLHRAFSVKRDRVYPKPVYSYSCLIALALKNSRTGNLPVNEIYNFMCENFPFFKTAPDGWKNSVRHNLSLNKCFTKVDNPKLSKGAKKGCLWAMNPARVQKMDDEITKWRKKDPASLLSSMAYPENLEAIEKGLVGLPSHGDFDSEDENESSSPPPPQLKTELMSTPKKEAEPMADELVRSPLISFELEDEYAARALQWDLSETDMHDLDLVTDPYLAPSPIASQGSPLPRTPSRSVHNQTPTFVRHGSCGTSSSAHHFVSWSSSTVRANLFGATSPRTLSARN